MVPRADGHDRRSARTTSWRGGSRAVLAFRHDRPCRTSDGTGSRRTGRATTRAFLGPGVPLPACHHRRGHRAAALPALLRAVPPRPEVRGADRARPRRRPPAEPRRAPTTGCSTPGCRADQQAGPPVYADNDLDRGHLVMRASSTWGDTEDEARRAEAETFYFTNAAPQAALVQPGPGAVAGPRGLPPGARGHLRPEAGRLRRPGPRPGRPALPRASRSRCGSGRSWRSSRTAPWPPPATSSTRRRWSTTSTRRWPSAAAAGAVPPLGAFRTFQVPIADIAVLAGVDLDQLDPRRPARRAGHRRDAATARPGVVDLGGAGIPGRRRARRDSALVRQVATCLWCRPWATCSRPSRTRPGAPSSTSSRSGTARRCSSCAPG